MVLITIGFNMIFDVTGRYLIYFLGDWMFSKDFVGLIYTISNDAVQIKEIFKTQFEFFFFHWMNKWMCSRHDINVSIDPIRCEYIITIYTFIKADFLHPIHFQLNCIFYEYKNLFITLYLNSWISFFFTFLSAKKLNTWEEP